MLYGVTAVQSVLFWWFVCADCLSYWLNRCSATDWIGFRVWLCIAGNITYDIAIHTSIPRSFALISTIYVSCVLAVYYIGLDWNPINSCEYDDFNWNYKIHFYFDLNYERNLDKLTVYPENYCVYIFAIQTLSQPQWPRLLSIFC